MTINRTQLTSRLRTAAPATALAAVLASATLLGTHVAKSAEPVEQGWTETDRHFFYRTTQGSRLLPYDIYQALEIPGSDTLFASEQHLQPMGYVYEAPTEDNPDHLPIGFVMDESDGRPPALGFTCAACHTSEISFGDTRLRIDGGQGQGDMERFLHELEAALAETLASQDKFRRMRDALQYHFLNEYQLRARLNDVHDKIAEENASNAPDPESGGHDPGPGRLDAFSHIKNRVADYVYDDSYLESELNRIDATAPVNFPHLWDAPYLDYVQWPSVVPNWGPGSLARNVGEVLGVFAETNVERDFWGNVTVNSSARLDNLMAIEETLLRLKSPQWPTTFPPLDETLVSAGEPLFEQYCESCHVHVDRGERTRHIDTYAVGADVLGTDPAMADNNLDDYAPQGKLGPYLDRDQPLNPNEILTELVTELITPVVDLQLTLELTASHKQPLFTAARNTQLAADEDERHTYKARPLNGIWATAPYLHNGSVRTLEELMKPGADRETSFCVGTTEYDPVTAGFVGDCALPANQYTFDTGKAGNSRLGHEYGTEDDPRLPTLTAQQRAAIVEYMKSL